MWRCCGIEFNSQANYDAHFSTDHPIAPPKQQPSPKMPTVLCPLCRKNEISGTGTCAECTMKLRKARFDKLEETCAIEVFAQLTRFIARGAEGFTKESTAIAAWDSARVFRLEAEKRFP